MIIEKARLKDARKISLLRRKTLIEINKNDYKKILQAIKLSRYFYLSKRFNLIIMGTSDNIIKSLFKVMRLFIITAIDKKFNNIDYFKNSIRI